MVKKKVSAAKEKKLARQALVKAERERKTAISQVAALTDLLDSFAPFCSLKCAAPLAAAASPDAAADAAVAADAAAAESQKLTLSFAHASALGAATKAQVFDLLKTNMEAKYEEAWGWNDKTKTKELFEDEARYILVRAEGSDDIVSFAHFRFSLEGVFKVVYIYEVQVEAAYRSQGIGKRLVQLLELIAVKHGLEWTMCTVFKCNPRSMKFFMDKMKYEIDETSPSQADVYEEEPYEILSKDLRRKVKAPTPAAATKLSGNFPAGWVPGDALPGTSASP